jgi:predicted  nucleic acid-binding Zn-ribbon protein
VGWTATCTACGIVFANAEHERDHGIETCLRRQLAAATNEAMVERNKRQTVERQLAAAQADNSRLREALEFYADPLKHNLMGEVNEDHGAIARAALDHGEKEQRDDTA